MLENYSVLQFHKGMKTSSLTVASKLDDICFKSNFDFSVLQDIWIFE